MDPWQTASDEVDPFISDSDLRIQMHHVLFGAVDLLPQGRPFVLRELTDQTCTACWSKDTGGSRRANCIYCQGEGYTFTERVVTMALFAGVAPVYKPAVLGNGQYPEAAYGYTDPDRATVYCEHSIWPNYERYTLPQTQSPNKLYEIKVRPDGQIFYDFTTQQPVRAAKWKILSVTPMFGDGSRVEYFELGCEKEVIS